VASQKSQHDDVVTPMLPASTRQYPVSQIQALFLGRLSRLLQLEEEWAEQCGSQDWRTRLIHKGIYSTYCDCIEVGVADLARQLIDRARSSGHA
jgi:hypothetical protein